MGLLARLLLGCPRSGEDQSDLWIDVDKPGLAGLGALADRLEIEARLGPPVDYWARRRGFLEYPQLGIQVRLDQGGHLAGFMVWTGAEAEGAFTGRWEPFGTRRAPGETDLVAKLGEPDRREVDEEEVMLSWTRSGTYLGADFDLAGRLTDFVVDFDAG